MLRMRARCSSGGIVERLAHRGRALLGVVGIDDERLREFPGGPGELRQDQHAALVLPRGDELLGHEVHAVVQARDEAEVGGAVVRVDALGVVVLDLEDDRLAARRGEAVVDALGGRAHARVERLVLVDARAAGRGDLDEGEAADPARAPARGSARWRRSARGCPWCSRGGRRPRRGPRRAASPSSSRMARAALGDRGLRPRGPGAATRSRSGSGAPRWARRRRRW